MFHVKQRGVFEELEFEKLQRKRDGWKLEMFHVKLWNPEMRK